MTVKLHVFHRNLDVTDFSCKWIFYLMLQRLCIKAFSKAIVWIGYVHINLDPLTEKTDSGKSILSVLWLCNSGGSIKG